MTQGAYLLLLFAGQLALIGIDLHDQRLSRQRSAGVEALRPASVLFLSAVVVVYGCVQFGGLAVAPDLAELQHAARTWVSVLLPGIEQDRAATPAAIVITGVAGFYFTGLCDYLFHRFAAHSRLLWFAHENHHLTTNVAAFMPGLCVRPFAVLAVMPPAAAAIFAVQFALGITRNGGWDFMPVLYAVALAQAGVLGLSHSSAMRRCAPVNRLLRPLGITTPREHFLHHVADLECNYGNFTIVWDRLFGTYVDPNAVDASRHRAGLSYDQDYLGSLTFGRWKLPESWRRRFQLERSCHLAPLAGQTARPRAPQ